MIYIGNVIYFFQRSSSVYSRMAVDIDADRSDWDIHVDAEK